MTIGSPFSLGITPWASFTLIELSRILLIFSLFAALAAIYLKIKDGSPHRKGRAHIPNKLLSFLRTELKNPKITYKSHPTPIEGGYESPTYKFQITGASENLSTPLILKIFINDNTNHKAVFESAVQNALVDLGYLVPRVYFASDDSDTFGAGFIIMEYIPGNQLNYEPTNSIPEIMAKAHLKLHSIDTDRVKDAVLSSGIGEERITFQWRLKQLKEKIETSGLEWIYQGLRWVVETRPEEPERLAVVHGDFHPLNILMHKGEVSAVLDWSGFLIADPAYDVAITRLIGFTAVPPNWPKITREYFEHYQKESQVNADNVGYYEAFRCLWALVEGAEGHSVWGIPVIMGRLSEHFEALTGVKISPPE
jgi:Ser/Thr protein kinase RdoA (MazF antagonist)